MTNTDPSTLLNQSPQVDASLQEAEDFFKSENSGKNSPTTPQAALEKQIMDMEQQIAAADLTPAARYLKRLEEAKISLSKANTIVDSVCVRMDPWEEEYVVIKNIKMRLRSRGIASQLEFHRMMEAAKVYRDSTYLDELRMHALSHSLIAYGPLTFNPEATRQATVAWLGRVPPAMFDIMYARLFEFDEMIRTVFSEGYIENF